MKQRLKNSGIYVLLLLYCVTILSVHAGEPIKTPPVDFDQKVGVTQSSKLELIQELTAQFDVELKSSSEKNEKQKRKLAKLVFTAYVDLSYATEVFLLRESEDVHPHCFSQTNILFPFHSFW